MIATLPLESVAIPVSRTKCKRPAAGDGKAIMYLLGEEGISWGLIMQLINDHLRDNARNLQYTQLIWAQVLRSFR